MEIMEVIRKRRSIRNYQDKKIPGQVMADLKEAFRLAPSGSNRQPYRFYFIEDAETRNAICSKACHQDFIGRAPLIIAATCEKGRAFDVAIAMQNIVLAATAHGLGSCYIGWFERDEVRKILCVREEMEIPILCVFGYPNETPGEKERKGIEEIAVMI